MSDSATLLRLSRRKAGETAASTNLLSVSTMACCRYAYDRRRICIIKALAFVAGHHRRRWSMKVATVMLCGFLVACAAPPPPPSPASEDESREATHAYIECLVNAARRLDDKVSDARAIAAAIRPICEGEYRMAMVVQTRHLPLTSRARIMPDLMNDYSNHAVAAVLLSRRRESSQAPVNPQR